MGGWVHRLLSKDPAARTGVCAHCGEVNLTMKDGYLMCAVARQERRGPNKGRNLYRKPSKGGGFRPGHPRRQAILDAQGGLCLICEADITESSHWDHCHDSGIFRGLLCRGCNLGLGNFGDRPGVLRKAAEYLEARRP